MLQHVIQIVHVFVRLLQNQFEHLKCTRSAPQIYLRPGNPSLMFSSFFESEKRRANASSSALSFPLWSLVPTCQVMVVKFY